MDEPLSDTSPAAHRAHIELLRKATNSQRAALALELSDTVIALSKRAIRRANPDASEIELAWRFVAQHYGKDLADGVRRKLEARLAVNKP